MRAVYCIENIQNKKRYIGQTVNYIKRYAQHRCDLNAGRHDNKYLQADWDLYGEKSFVFYILEEDPDDLCEAEKYWIKKTGSFVDGYNMTSGGLGTPEIEAWNKGKKQPERIRKILSESAKKRIGEKNSFFGRKHTEETKKRISQFRSIPVVDLSTGDIYPSAKAADIAFGGRSSNVSKCLKGECLTAYGRKWEYSSV